ncbi:MAG: nitroreductase family protein [Bacteroidales bacterium]|nr:nitroreductase family protein [Bacteroidales bacterium]MDD4830119.1 nitroreductase family protein [Bacteroidales bacterium]
MAIPTSRTKEPGEIIINTEKCIGCGLCVKVCKDYSLEIKDNKVYQRLQSCFGCIACGHCMAICPKGAIEIYGRILSPKDLFDLPQKHSATDYNSLLSLCQRRRSVREFKDKEVDRETIEKILSIARTSPMGLPPSDVNVLIFDSKEKTNQFAKDFCNFLKGMKWMFSNFSLSLMSPFLSKANNEMFKEFVQPLFSIYGDNMDKGINYVTYDAPVALYFYGSPYTDPADPIIAATYAMLAAESLGLGTCMLGAIHPLIQYGGKAKKFREAQGIKYKSREGLFVILGYPDVEYNKGIKRTFASETYK